MPGLRHEGLRRLEHAARTGGLRRHIHAPGTGACGQLADFLVLVVPHSPETENLVDAPVLAAMKPGAFLINVARGGVLDEEALIRALRPGRSPAPRSTCSAASRCPPITRCGTRTG